VALPRRRLWIVLLAAVLPDCSDSPAPPDYAHDRARIAGRLERAQADAAHLATLSPQVLTGPTYSVVASSVLPIVIIR